MCLTVGCTESPKATNAHSANRRRACAYKRPLWLQNCNILDHRVGRVTVGICVSLHAVKPAEICVIVLPPVVIRTSTLRIHDRFVGCICREYIKVTSLVCPLPIPPLSIKMIIFAWIYKHGDFVRPPRTRLIRLGLHEPASTRRIRRCEISEQSLAHGFAVVILAADPRDVATLVSGLHPLASVGYSRIYRVRIAVVVFPDFVRFPRRGIRL